MSAPKESTFKTDIEQAIIHSFIPTNKFKWTLNVTPQLSLYAKNMRDAIVKYVTTPAILVDVIVPPVGSTTSGPVDYLIPHNLGYIPTVNPPEKWENISIGVFEFRMNVTGGPKFIRVTASDFIVNASVGDRIRIIAW